MESEPRKPKGHGDFADLIRDLWTGSELRRIEEELEDLERHPGYARLTALLDARERLLVDRLVVGAPGDVRGTDQMLGIANGLRSVKRAVASIRHEANEARERAERAAADADAERSTA
jgi:hypothetical protein